MYHPLISLIPTKFCLGGLRNTLKLPFSINGILTLSWLIITLTLALALSNLSKDQFLCKDSRKNDQYYICREAGSSDKKSNSILDDEE